MYDVMHEWLTSADFEVAGWKLEKFRLYDSERPLLRMDPTWVEVMRQPYALEHVWRSRRPGLGARARAGDRWLALLDGIDESSDDGEDALHSSSSSSSEEDNSSGTSAMVSGQEYSRAGSEVALSDEESLSGDEMGDHGLGSEDSGGDSEPDTSSDADSALFVSDAGEEGTDSDERDEDAGADAAAAARMRGKVTMELDVAGGILRYYAAKRFVVAHCLRHGAKACRLTRTLKRSERRDRRAQGRPLGLCMAWLACAGHEDLDTARLHKAMDPMPGYDARVQGRAELGLYADAERWFRLERPPRHDEDEEPENAPGSRRA